MDEYMFNSNDVMSSETKESSGHTRTKMGDVDKISLSIQPASTEHTERLGRFQSN